MEANHVAQLNVMQIIFIAMEISQANRFLPRKNNERWQRKVPPRDQMPPNQLETTNMVQRESPPFFRSCEYFHEDSTCPILYHMNEKGFLEINNYV